MTDSDIEVSSRICKALLEKKLISQDDAKTLTNKIASGQIKETDWLTMFRSAQQVSENDVPEDQSTQ